MPERPKIVAMLPVRNESAHYLRDALANLTQWVDAIIVLDDASDDDTFEVATSFSKVIYYQNNTPEYGEDDRRLQSKLWQLASGENPDWVLAINTDEIFEDRIIDEIGLLLEQNDYDIVCFRVFHFWKSDSHYRIDGNWNPWKNFQPFIVRYKPELEKADPYTDVYSFFSDIRIKHFGWDRKADEEDTKILLEEWVPSKQLYFLKG